MVLATLLLSSPTISNAGVGEVTEQTGPTEIKRQNAFVPSSLHSGVEMNDTITTANAKAGITFIDNTKVEITEQSKLVIDNFVYDGEKKAGKLGIKMALGTIKYASGQIAKNDPQQVKVETPTATIGVRGTDFSGTVDETGKSTIILLPSCPVGWKDVGRDCITGNISVTTIMGTIWLTKPFESVTVQTGMTKPVSSILNLDLSQINNLLIVTPPKGKAVETTTATKQINFLDQDFLKQDLLKYDELNKNYLDGGDFFKDPLAADYFLSMLDVTRSQLLGNELEQYGKLLPKYDPASGIKYTVANDQVLLYRETVNSYAEVNVETTRMSSLTFDQENVAVKQLVNGPGTTTITIKQSQ